MYQNKEDISKLAELLKDAKFVMLTTLDEEGALRSRPMTFQEMEFDGDLWFFTSKSTTQAEDITRRNQVNISLSQPEKSVYLSLTGTAELVDDKAKAKELWKPTLKAWFPKGLRDPDMTLIRVSVQSAELWQSPSSQLVQAFAFAKAILTGNRAHRELGTQEHIEISR
ncbi:MAG: pyridoxamine 5'-phosphate oxidase family protein [Bdellovibrionales bacterium]|nr:pyridoxamine 5'-phosphate oxidase family protein [Bdellovibrionales bacterium]